VKKVLFIGLIFQFLFSAQSALAQPIKVCVSILPQKYFVQKIGGELVDVSVMVQPGASPATYEPKPKQMVALAKTKVYFAIGVPFETAWLDKISATNHRMLIVHTEEGIEKIPMTSHLHHQDSTHNRSERRGYYHTEGEQDREEHHHGVKDPHVWLSPPLVMQQARNIFAALAALDPPHLESYQTNYSEFIMELVALDLELKRVFLQSGGHTQFMVFHPSWGYFARAYGLEQAAIEFEGKEPKPSELASMISYAKDRSIKVIFAQPQFSRQAAHAIARAIGGQVILVDPLALDWANNLREAASKFKNALK
jgi:zinc transport system substrate-binding protein